MDFGFEALGLGSAGNQCFARNSNRRGSVEKTGLRHEGCMRQAFLKNGV